MEILNLYDNEGRLLNKTIERGEKFDNGNIMLSIVFIKNSNSKYLIQKTSEKKGSKFSSTGGHVSYGENGVTTIIREIKEELGLSIKSDDLDYVALVKHPNRPCLISLYLLNMDINIKSLEIQTDEVSSVYWMDEQEVLKLIKEDRFLVSHGYLFEKYIVEK